MFVRLNRRVIMCVAAMAVCFVAGACTKKANEQAEKKPMTTAQRDSAIAASKLPGANVVGKALEVADSAEVRANKPVPEPR
jgi:hypothetical protein